MKSKIYLFTLLNIFMFALIGALESKTSLDEKDANFMLGSFGSKKSASTLTDCLNIINPECKKSFFRKPRHFEYSEKKRCECTKKPNILFFIVDELRFPPEYESEELKAWKRENLVFENMLASKGTVFHQHYANTNACSPSRATLHTGQYPSVHGVTQTAGLAKPEDDPSATWMRPHTVPTIGNYLRLAGYKTVLKGKWHVSNSSIRLEDGSNLPTFNSQGDPIPSAYAFYLEKNVLDVFGYDGWIGPEPHGSDPLNSASSVPFPDLGRDIKFTEQILDELDILSHEEKPWLLIASYVNPHDISLYSIFTALSSATGGDWSFLIDPTLPEKLFKDEFMLSENESLLTKPAAQLSYRDLFATTIQPIPNMDTFQRLYYTLLKRVNINMMKVWEKLVSSPMYKDTIIVFSSDHGELLGSHGKMVQKFYVAYQEAIHVPLIISSPLFNNRHQDVYDLTSHIDILPTFLNFAKADAEAIRRKLGKSFTLNLPLPGKTLLPLIQVPYSRCRKITPIYFYTEDDPTKGPNQVNPICQPYDSVVQPSSVEAVIACVDGELWKLTNYFTIYGGCGNPSGITHELYNETKDPMELVNLYDNPAYSEIQQELLNLLNYYATIYRAAS